MLKAAIAANNRQLIAEKEPSPSARSSVITGLNLGFGAAENTSSHCPFIWSATTRNTGNHYSRPVALLEKGQVWRFCERVLRAPRCIRFNTRWELPAFASLDPA